MSWVADMAKNHIDLTQLAFRPCFDLTVFCFFLVLYANR